MKIKTADNVAPAGVEGGGAEGVTIRLLIHEADDAPNFYMRQFNIAPGGHTPRHSHPWEHEVYVLAGEGEVFAPDGEKRIAAGDCVFVPGDEEHQFRGIGEAGMKMLCLVPKGAGC
jgi:quercetin dioxygenase-like cupin family protein